VTSPTGNWVLVIEDWRFGLQHEDAEQVRGKPRSLELKEPTAAAKNAAVCVPV